jgi:protein gp37
MGQRSAIEWTDSTWNPVTGCTKVSAGCDHCYAHALAHKRLRDVYLRQLPVLDTPERRGDPFAVRVWPERFDQPVKWREPRMIFVNSMSDLFHQEIPAQAVREIFEVMLHADWHVYQVLTKRPALAAKFVDQNGDLFPAGAVPGHIWMGTSVEDSRVEYRIRHLRQVNAELRFLSCEPLLGPIGLDLTGIHWVIAGGESGAGRRPPRPEWVTRVRDQCLAADVPFFFKQWGGRTPKAGGRELDGRTWDELPTAAAVA